MDLYEALMTTRSMRRMSDEPVGDEVIQRILRAAVQASSGGNIQPYQFMVVTDADIKKQLAAIYRRAHERYRPAVQAITPPPKDAAAERRMERIWAAVEHLVSNLADVPVMVLVLVPRISMDLHDDEGTMDIGSVYASVYPAVQNLILAARGEGLGTVLTTLLRVYEAEAREVCGIPERYEVAAMLPLGVPLGNWGVAHRRPAERLTSWNHFGNRRPALED